MMGSFIALLFLVGCRNSELRTSKWRDIDLVEKKMFVPTTKNGTGLTIYLTPFIIKLFRELLAIRKWGNPYVFHGRNEGEHISQPRNAFTLIKQGAGIKNESTYMSSAQIPKPRTRERYYALKHEPQY